MQCQLLISAVVVCLTFSNSVANDRNNLIGEVEQAIVQQTNEFRQKNDLNPVSADKELSACATEFATFMAKNDKYGHRADGRSPAQRAKAAGYDYCVVRENIAYRTNTGEVTAASLIEVFVQGWIDSPPHRENMLADFVTHTGVGVASVDGVTYYAVQMFGRPQSAAIQVKVANNSSHTAVLIIEANDSRDEIEIPHRASVTLKRCFPTILRVEGSDGEIHVTETTELTITAEGLQR